MLNAFITGNPMLGTMLLGISVERGFGALQGLRWKPLRRKIDDYGIGHCWLAMMKKKCWPNDNDANTRNVRGAGKA